jgi:hypothetical protein
LQPAHLTTLAQSCISPVTARENDLYSTTTPWGPALAFPYYQANGSPVTYRDATGQERPFIRYRLDTPATNEDGAEMRYYQPPGSGAHLYIPRAARAPFLEVSEPIIATEGEKKALASTEAGLPAVAVGGVWNWTTSTPEAPAGTHLLIPELAAMPMGGRRINIVFDSDVRLRPDLRQALYHFAVALRTAGAIPYIVNIPGRAGGPKVGLDDYLVANNGGGSLEGLIRAARPYRPPLTPQDEGTFTVINGRLARQRMVEGQGPNVVYLATFEARIVREIHHDGGTGEVGRVEWEIAASLPPSEDRPDGGALPTIRVPKGEFRGMAWVSSLGPSAVLMPGFGAQDQARAAIQLISRRDGGYARHTVFGHTGWRRINNAWGYLHGGGVIGVPGESVEMDLAHDLQSRYVLPAPPVGAERAEAVRASLKMFYGLGPDRVIFLGRALSSRVVLGKLDFAVHVSGPSGEKKSEWTSLEARHFGPSMERLQLPANWCCTPNHLRELAHILKDAPLFIDDFSPAAANRTREDLYRVAEQVYRSQGNLAGRGRMRSDTSLRASKAPRGSLLTTGEELPRGSSLRARVLTTGLGKGAINDARLAECQADAKAGKYALGMAAYLAWLTPKYDEVQRTLHERTQSYVSRRRGSEHARTPHAIAALLVGLSYWFEFCVEVGACTRAEADALMERGRRALAEVGQEQDALINAEDPVRLFRDLLGAAVVGGRAFVATKDGKAPPDPHLWGWDTSGDVPRSRGTLVGFHFEDGLFLYPASSYSATQEEARRQGAAQLADPLTLWQRMATAGCLVTTEMEKRGTYKTRKRIGGKQVDLLHCRLDFLDAEILEGPPVSGDSPDSSDSGGGGGSQDLSGNGVATEAGAAAVSRPCVGRPAEPDSPQPQTGAMTEVSRIPGPHPTQISDRPTHESGFTSPEAANTYTDKPPLESDKSGESPGTGGVHIANEPEVLPGNADVVETDTHIGI